jgi:hypothetical protein
MASAKKRRKIVKRKHESLGNPKSASAHPDGDRRRKALGLTVREALEAKRRLRGDSILDGSDERTDEAEDTDWDDLDDDE